PALIRLIEKLSRDAAAKDGWHGLLVGDMSQPRGGPMMDGHASHQIGLDTDIWLMPMPDHILTRAERETMKPVSMVRHGTLQINPQTWTKAQARLIMRAASYPEVQRIFVHPAIKKELCEGWRGDRSDLGKVRPYWGHMWHMHIRIKCPPGSPDCRPQTPIPAGDGCGKPLAWWFTDEPWKPAKPSKKPAKPHVTTLADLPKACRRVLEAPAKTPVAAVTYQVPAAAAFADLPPSADIPVPIARPAAH
ncbi:MAG TPA: penicillin-insensitive murein endopeptidase, partial [Pararhizobium sp.]|nr:penicillin-insensitive murein endopeptidase [Pararhizobium sp.]